MLTKRLTLLLCTFAVFAQAQEAGTTIPAANRTFSISYVQSDRKWRFGVNSRTYDKVSQELEKLLTEKLTPKGFQVSDPLTGPCCKLVIEVVEVTHHTAAFGKVGMDLVATFSVQDGGGKQFYTKVYRAESRSAGMHTWGGMLDMAERELIDNALKHDDLVNALGGGNQ
jgi:hypothetical protein